MTKIEFTGTEKLFALLMKFFVCFTYDKFVLQLVEDGDRRIAKFVACDTQLNLSLVFQDYLVYEFLVQCKTLVFLGYLFLDHLQFILGSKFSSLSLSIV